MMALIPAWAWRWIAILAVGAALAFTWYVKGREAVQIKFDEYQAQVKAAGDRQNELTRQTIAAHKQLQESSDAQAQTAAASRDAALARVRALESARASIRIVPSAPTSAQGNLRICYPDRDELDRQVRGAMDEAAAEDHADSATGQTGVDVATVCRDWAAKR